MDCGRQTANVGAIANFLGGVHMATQSAWISIFTPAVRDDPARDKSRRAFPFTRPARVMAGNIKEGDLIIDYMQGSKCIVGVAVVTTPSSSATDHLKDARSPVLYDNNYELAGKKYPVYVKVTELVIDVNGVSVSDVLPKLSIFGRLKGPNKWGSFFRSAQHWDYTDGEIVLQELRRRERSPRA